jgi:hypothetical protein
MLLTATHMGMDMGMGRHMEHPSLVKVLRHQWHRTVDTLLPSM